MIARVGVQCRVGAAMPHTSPNLSALKQAPLTLLSFGPSMPVSPGLSAGKFYPSKACHNLRLDPSAVWRLSCRVHVLVRPAGKTLWRDLVIIMVSHVRILCSCALQILRASSW